MNVSENTIEELYGLVVAVKNTLTDLWFAERADLARRLEANGAANVAAYALRRLEEKRRDEEGDS